MSLRDELDLSLLNNAAVNWVLEALETELDRWPRIRDNHEAILDVMAYALNQLRPRYHVTLLGTLYAQSPSEEQRDEVRQVVQKALVKIDGDFDSPG